ncbi:MAG: translocation/assembly module TamB domain-containing protein [Myxococcota bacterium]
MEETPNTDLHADARVRFHLDDRSQPRLRFTGEVAPTTLYDVALPRMDADVLVDANGVSGLAHLHEPGMPVRADFTVSSSGKVRVSAVTNVPSLAAVPRLRGAASGYAVGKLEGTFESGKIDATMSVNAGNLSRPGLRLGSASVDAHTWGTPDALRMDVALRGSGVVLSGARWAGVDLRLRGPIRAPHARLTLVDNTMPHIAAEAGLSLGPRVAARNVQVQLERAGEVVDARSDLVEVRNGTLDLGALAIDGLGEPIDALARIGAGGFDVRLVSDGVKLDSLSRLLNLPGPPVSGTAEVDVDLRNVGDESRGCVRVDVHDGKVHALPTVSGIDLSLRAAFVGRHVEVDTAVSVGGKREGQFVASTHAGVCLPARPVREDGIAELRASASLALGGPPVQVDSWKDATGTARLVRMLVSLDRIDRMVSPLVAIVPDLEIPRAGGTVELTGDVVRDRPEAPPAWSLTASTRALNIELDQSKPAQAIQGADLFASATMHRGGLLQASMCVRDDLGAYDTEPCDPRETNVLASLGFLAELDYQRLYDDPSEWKTVLHDARIDGRAVVHDRPAEALLRPLPLEEPLPVEADRARAVVGFRGTPLAPHIDYQVQLERLGPRDPGWRTPTTVCAQGSYDGQRAWVHTVLRRLNPSNELGLEDVCRAAPADVRDAFGFVDADMLVAWEDILAWPSLPRIPWVANVNAVVHAFELSDVPALADRGIAGRARLSGGIRGLGTKPDFDLQLGLEDFRTGAAVDYDQGNVRVHTDASGLDGSFALVDVDETGNAVSQVTVRLDTEQVRWEGGLIPTRDGSKPVHIEAKADRFKVGVLSSLVRPVLSYVDGELTGRAKATWSPEQGESRIDELYFFLDHGAFQIPFIGQEFLQVRGTLQAANSNRIFVEHFQAQSQTGALRGRATIDLDDLDIERVDASLWTPDEDKIRLTFKGIPVGDFRGDVRATIVPDDDRIETALTFDNVQVDLPKTDLRSVQQLDDNPDITVVPTLRAVDGARGAEAADATPWVVTLETKSPAVLKRSDMNFTVITPRSESDMPVLRYPDPDTGEATLEGHVLLYDGRVDVLGNFFYLEENNARVVFDGDPGDPKLSVTARWDAPDGTRVFADVTGPLRAPRIQFRSEPAMPQSEVLALLLFGPQTQGAGTTTTGPQDGEGNAARDVGGGVASAGINMLLQDLSPVVSTRIDTSRGQSPSPTVVVQVSRDVTAEATYISDETSLDRSDRYLLTFDWRLLRQWSLRITRGNAGTSILDVLWQHRY